MKNVLRYILSLFCFVALMGNSKTETSEYAGCRVVVDTVMKDACISIDGPECIFAQPTSSVNGMQRVQKNLRKNNTNQRRSVTFLNDGRMTYSRLYHSAYINQHLRFTDFPFTVLRLISFGKLVI